MPLADISSVVRKAVIPAAGLGTRLLPLTKEIPKEMLPLAVYKNAAVLLKPILQVVFEQLFDDGIREFGFVTGRGKRSIEDHFTIDRNLLLRRTDSIWVNDLTDFYRRLESSNILFVNQPVRRGFGDAVLQAKNFVNENPFLVHAGADFVISAGTRHLEDLANAFKGYNADAALLIESVRNPRKFGVVVGERIEKNTSEVRKIVKPVVSPSNLAVMAMYVFNGRIFDAIRDVGPDKTGEIHPTNAIQRLIEKGRTVIAVKLGKTERRVEIGESTSYICSLSKVLRIQAWSPT